MPAGAKTVALIADDPDAPGGTWVHWVIYGIAATTSELPEGVPKTETLPNASRQSTNDFKRIGYGGPCPPPGSVHRYFFKLYALASDPQLKAGATKQDLLNAMKGHSLAQGQLSGKYQRR